MHIPSERIYNKIHAAVASMWFVPANDGAEVSLLVKVPTPTLKALVAGCPLRLLFGKKDTYLCVGARIEDMPDTPVLLAGAQVIGEEQEALIRAMKQKVFPIFLFNEMDICLASSSIGITVQDSLAVLRLLGSKDSLYNGEFSPGVSYAIDCFVSSVDKTKIYPNSCEIPVIEITPKVGIWETIDVYFINNGSSYAINISSEEEGGMFENTIWGCLESVFPTTLYKSPQVKHGDKKREFTDVFACHEYGSFLIEAKDLSVIQAGYQKGEQRRLTGIQRQVTKGIKQLVGAAKAFKQGDALYSIDGNEILVNREIPPHAIILITELMTCGDWEEITKQLLDAMKETGALFHLLDFREFITLLKQSSGNPKLIDYNLVERCKFFLKTESVFIRGI